MKKLLIFITLFAGAYGLSFISLKLSMPQVKIEAIAPASLDGGKSLPFYELMSPLPETQGTIYLPRLEYKKGPPDRYIESIALIFSSSPLAPKERILYYGRKTRMPSLTSWFAGERGENLFLKAAFHYSQTGEIPSFWQHSSLLLPLEKLVFLWEALQWLSGVENIAVMDQVGSPSFLFTYVGGQRAKVVFFRRSSVYQVEYLADKSFRILDPRKLFSRSFLVEKRADALEFVAKNLANVHFGDQSAKNLKLAQAAWPLALLATDLSLDPKSITAYFHFAGLSALLYKSSSTDLLDTESTDILRNNVLTASLYATDVDPSSSKTAEIAQLSRTLTSKF